MASAARNGVLTLVGLLVLLAAAGWLYLVRPSTGGLRPAVTEALPLDELANKAGVSVVAFLAVWGCAALLLGLLARAARLDRLTAAVVLMVGVAAFEFVAVGVSLAVVRQVSFHQAFATATGIRAVILPALLAALVKLNRSYEEKFGFRFVVFVDGRPRAEVLSVLRQRLQNSRDEELAAGLDDLVAIALDRWRKR